MAKRELGGLDSLGELLVCFLVGGVPIGSANIVNGHLVPVDFFKEAFGKVFIYPYQQEA